MNLACIQKGMIPNKDFHIVRALHGSVFIQCFLLLSMKDNIFFIVLGINFIFLFNMEINYILSQKSNIEIINDTTRVSDVLTPDSINNTRFSNINEGNNSVINTTRVSDVLTPDSINNTRFSNINEGNNSVINTTRVSDVLTP
ncbi:MAG: hypothetical protein ACE5SW_13195, partial [Nitrososphaeraceae archaeon]